MRKSNYKPLLLTTTIRSPERLKDFLRILLKYDQEILNINVINSVVKELIKTGLYQPIRSTLAIKSKWNNQEDLTDEEVLKVFIDNPQQHKEAGFEKGWPSRFDTWFKIAKELGFVYYNFNQKIDFSESGKFLLKVDHPENETIVFANAFAKYYRKNPFKRVLNDNVPLVLLLETIRFINSDDELNATGISRAELPLLLCWKDDNANELYQLIKKLRTEHGNKLSDEIILDLCQTLIDEGKRDPQSLLIDYPDEFIRKMRLTGLISIRGGGRYIDINTKENLAVDYILTNYKIHPALNSEIDFFTYMGIIDDELIEQLTVFRSVQKASNADLLKWVEHFQWEQIKLELMNLSLKNPSKDIILKLIEQPLRLEFLTSLAILKKLPKVTVKPSFVTDDEGLPVGFASGVADIECEENDSRSLVEVTLLTGTQQHIRESFSIRRHLEEYLKTNPKAFTLFLSPSAFIDTIRHARFIEEDGLDVRILNIDEFIKGLEMEKTLEAVSLYN